MTPRRIRYEYGVLWSHASHMVYEDLVDGPYPSRAAADFTGVEVARVQGVKYELCRRPRGSAGDAWRTVKGDRRPINAWREMV